MDKINPKKPVILVFAGHDPSGGAGIQADIESIAVAGCHATTVMTTLTQQNTMNFSGHHPQNINNFILQTRLILEDFDISAIKIGVVGSEKLVNAIAELLIELKNIPVVLDPVIKSSSGYIFSDFDLCKNLTEKLFPLITIATPNIIEAKTLAGIEGTLDNIAERLLSRGGEYILITDTHDSAEQVVNTLYSKDKPPVNFEYQRLAGEFHGSGCTLSSSIAAHLALGCSMEDAVKTALNYTWECLNHALSFGSGVKLPNRVRSHIKDN